MARSPGVYDGARFAAFRRRFVAQQLKEDCAERRGDEPAADDGQHAGNL